MTSKNNKVLLKTATKVSTSVTVAASFMLAISVVALTFSWGMMFAGLVFKIAVQQDPCTECSDGIDNDGDGLVDGDDPACSHTTTKPHCREVHPKYACDDGIDNDGDGLRDSQDTSCSLLDDDDEDVRWRFDTGEEVDCEIYTSQSNFLEIPALGNFDTDSFSEIVLIRSAVNPCKNEVVILDNNGDFRTSIELTGLGWDTYLSPPTTSDLDGDGDDEIVIEAWQDHVFSRVIILDVILFDSRAEYQYHEVRIGTCDIEQSDYEHWFSRPPAIGDLDGDGDKEIIASSCDHLYLISDYETGRIDWEKDFGNISNTRDLSHPILADLNNDDNLEVIVLQIDDRAPHQGWPDLNQYNWKIFVYNYAGDKIAEYEIINYEHENPYKEPQFAAGDMDNDGRQDIVIGYNDRIFVLSLKESKLIKMREYDNLYGGISKRVTGVSLGDINGDGLLDIAATYARYFFDAGGVIVIDNQGNELLRSLDGATSNVNLSDIDGDGRLEILAGAKFISSRADPAPELFLVYDDNLILDDSFIDYHIEGVYNHISKKEVTYEPWNEELSYSHPITGYLDDTEKVGILVKGDLLSELAFRPAILESLLYHLGHIVKPEPAGEISWPMYLHDPQHTSRAGACVEDEDCDNGDSRTLDTCVNYTCQHRRIDTEKEFIRGDVDGDGDITRSDAVYLLLYLFKGGTVPGCLKTADINDDGQLDIADPIYLMNYLFAGGPEPPAPFNSLEIDPTPDNITCEHYP